MQYVLTASEMKRCDEATIEYFQVPSCVLMERAALCVRDEIRARTPAAQHFLIVCGTGNNGGDGMALSRMLALEGGNVTVVLLGDRSRASAEALRQINILSAYDIPLLEEIPEGTYDWVIDAIFGISLSRDVSGIYADAVRKMNEMPGRKLAVDISSGVAADTGHVMGIAFRADLTVTMAYPKYGQILNPGRTFTGELVIAQIGITDESFLEAFPAGRIYGRSDLSLMPPRKADSNKGTYGRLLSVTGSENMAGAAYLASRAAYRTGAGLVYIETPESNRQILQTLLPEAVLCTYWSGLTAKIREDTDRMNAVICGCGLGTGEDSRLILEAVLRYADAPLVLDADALNLISEVSSLREMAASYPAPLILTPHIGEASRLLQRGIDSLKEDPVIAAQTIAETFHGICVLKDAVTVVAQEDQIYLNTSGCNAMAKGGSGDVLTGVIGGLLAQGSDPWTAATLGVYLHGLAGEAAAEKTGSWSLLASELTDGISVVLHAEERH